MSPERESDLHVIFLELQPRWRTLKGQGRSNAWAILLIALIIKHRTSLEICSGIQILYSDKKSGAA